MLQEEVARVMEKYRDEHDFSLEHDGILVLLRFVVDEVYICYCNIKKYKKYLLCNLILYLYI